jgi:hypothetical protein
MRPGPPSSVPQIRGATALSGFSASNALNLKACVFYINVVILIADGLLAGRVWNIKHEELSLQTIEQITMILSPPQCKTIEFLFLNAYSAVALPVVI